MKRIIACSVCLMCLAASALVSDVDVESILGKIDRAAVRESAERERKLRNEMSAIFGLGDGYGASVPLYELSRRIREVYIGRHISSIDLCLFLKLRNVDIVGIEKDNDAIAVLLTNVFRYGEAGDGKVMIGLAIQLNTEGTIEDISITRSMDGL